MVKTSSKPIYPNVFRFEKDKLTTPEQSLLLNESTETLKKWGSKVGSTNGAVWVLGEPCVNTLEMESVVAIGKQSSRLVALNVVKAHGAFGGLFQFFPGDSGKLLQLQRGQPLDLRLERKTYITYITELVKYIAKGQYAAHAHHN